MFNEGIKVCTPSKIHEPPPFAHIMQAREREGERWEKREMKTKRGRERQREREKKVISTYHKQREVMETPVRECCNLIMSETWKQFTFVSKLNTKSAFLCISYL